MRTTLWIGFLLPVCLLGCDEAPRAGAATPAISATQGASSAAPARAPRAAAAESDSALASEGELEPEAPQAPAEPLLEAPLLLETRVEREGQTWAARWRVTNRGSSPVYLVTQLPRLEDGIQIPAPALIYRRAEEETLYLTKRLWRIPAAVDPLIQVVPFLTRLEPGQAYVGGVRIPPAIRESYPYQAGFRRAEIERLVISFGYFGEEAKPVASAEHPGLYQVSYGALGQQRYLTSAAAAVRLEVR